MSEPVPTKADDTSSPSASTWRTPPWRTAPWRVLSGALKGFIDDNVMSLAASLSFYTLLSFAPLLLLGVWVSSLVGYDAQQTIVQQISGLAGSNAGKAAQGVMNSANEHPSLGSIAGIFGIVVSLVGATTVFAQLQTSLNRIWGIQARPGNAIWGWLRRRVLSIGVIGATVFVLIVSLLVSTTLGAMLSKSGPGWDAINQVISTAVFAVLFAMLFRYLPDAQLAWKRALWGGVVTAILFAAGKWVIGFYLSSGDVGGAYGAASSLVVLLVWVYYSSAIFFFGAEVVQAWAIESGEAIELEKHAEVVS